MFFLGLLPRAGFCFGVRNKLVASIKDERMSVPKRFTVWCGISVPRFWFRFATNECGDEDVPFLIFVVFQYHYCCRRRNWFAVLYKPCISLTFLAQCIYNIITLSCLNANAFADNSAEIDFFRYKRAFARLYLGEKFGKYFDNTWMKKAVMTVYYDFA